MAPEQSKNNGPDMALDRTSQRTVAIRTIAISASATSCMRTAAPAGTAPGSTWPRCAIAMARNWRSRVCAPGFVARGAAPALLRLTTFGMLDRTAGLSFLERCSGAMQVARDRLDVGQLDRGVELPFQLGNPSRPVRDVFLRSGHGR
jgi:hypothetical protein